MTGTLVTTTVKVTMNPLAFQGIMAYTHYSQITDMLRRKFGDEYVLLFSEPVENKGNGLIDWYSPIAGTPRKLADLPDAEKNAITTQIRDKARDIEDYANSLISTHEPQKITRGNILNLALVCPDYENVYVIGEQPVLACWGFGPGTSGVEPRQITRLPLPPAPSPGQAAPVSQAVPEPQSPPVTPVTPAAQTVGTVRSLGWLWWLLPFSTALLLILLLCTSFGNLKAISGIELLHLPPLPFLDNEDYGENNEHDQKEAARLEAEISELQRKLNEHAAMCTPATAPAKPIPPVAEELVIPPQAHDTSFLEGKWLCDTGLLSMRTGEPVSLAFSFDANGNGTAITYEANDQCTGQVRAAMDNGELRISLGESRCSKGNHSYAPVEIICTNANGASTQCTGAHSDGHTWSAPFQRVR